MATIETLADLFAALWLRLEGDPAALAAAEARLSVETDTLRNRKHRLQSLLTRAGAGAIPILRAWVDGDADLDQTILVAQAIDGWYAPLGQGDAQGGPLSDDLTRAVRALRRHARLNTDADLGQVILRRPLWGRWSDQRAARPAEAMAVGRLFDTLVRLPPAVPATDPDSPEDRSGRRHIRFIYRMAREADQRPPRPGMAWRIGFAPVAEDEGDLDIAPVEHDGRVWYDVRARALNQRIDGIVAQMCADNVHIIAMPEMAVHPDSLEALKRAVRRYGPDSDLVLVFAGTGRIAAPNGGPPFNEAVVLDHRGEELFRQRKLHRWNLSCDACDRYGIPRPPDGQDRLYEFIAPGEEVRVIEQPLIGRLAVMICEDLSRSAPGRWLQSNLLLDWQFTPVLDSSLESERWVVREGAAAVGFGRCRVLVANSLPLTHRQNRCNRSAGAAQPIIRECGVGLCIDHRPDGIAQTIARVRLDQQPLHTAVIDWDPEHWPKHHGAAHA